MKKVHPTVKELLGEIEVFCRKAQMAPTAFGKRVMGDGHLVRRLRDGSEPTLATIDRIKRYMHEATKQQRKIWCE